MSAFATIKLDIKKFAKGTETDVEKFAVEFEYIWGKTPAALQVINNFVNEAAPVIIAASALADPVAEPAVVAALAVVETLLAALSASAKAANSGGSLLICVQNFATTVPQLLTGLAIKNPLLQKEITTIVNLVTAESKVLIPAITSWVSQLKAASAAAALTVPVAAPTAPVVASSVVIASTPGVATLPKA
jgi:hypothetical protein